MCAFVSTHHTAAVLVCLRQVLLNAVEDKVGGSAHRWLAGCTLPHTLRREALQLPCVAPASAAAYTTTLTCHVPQLKAMAASHEGLGYMRIDGARALASNCTYYFISKAPWTSHRNTSHGPLPSCLVAR